jgi:hypothetical protein
MTPEEVAGSYGMLGVAGFLNTFSDPRQPRSYLREKRNE